MDNKVFALAALLLVCFSSGTYVIFNHFSQSNSEMKGNISETMFEDPLSQGEGHDHRNSTHHRNWTDNIEFKGFSEHMGNAEVQVVTSPDGRTYTYQAGWREMVINDVTNKTNPHIMSTYTDPNTQVLDVKYIRYNEKEYVITQNQLVDSGNADPNVGEWNDPVQVSVNLIDVTDKTNPCWVDSWYDADHPSGPHNLFTHVIDEEWYIFVANPDYESCDAAMGEACGGVTIAHLNLVQAGNLGCSTPAYGVARTILKVGEAEVAWEATRGGWIYIHDMTVQTWPGEDQNDPRYGRTYIYGAYWEAGLRVFDVSDVPHPVNDPIRYALIAGGCISHTPVTCLWDAPEVGLWMEFADFDNDGQPDSGTTGNVNGGRSSYIHYVEPIEELVDLSHLGLGEGMRHLTFAAVEVLSTTEGTGIVYVIDTTPYEDINGNIVWRPEILAMWELPYGVDHCFGADCPEHPDGEEWLLFSPHNIDHAIFHTDSNTDTSNGGSWDGRLYISHYHAGLWIVDLETLLSPQSTNFTEINFESTIGFYLPHGVDGTPLDSQFYDFGWVPFLWAAEYYDGYTYISCITTGLYILQLDLDIPYEGDLSA